MKRPWIWRCLAASLLLVVFLVAGCSPTPRRGQVKGTVRFQNKALPSGTVEFHCANGETKPKAIAPDGTYQIQNVPVGTARICVISHPRKPGGFDPKPAFGKEAVPNLERYRKPETSPLTYEVHEGDQIHDIDLEP